MSRVAYLDCFAGISGDMFLGALVGAGVELAVLERAVATLGLEAGLRVRTVDRSGISSVKVDVLEGAALAEGRSAAVQDSKGNSDAEDAAHAQGRAQA